MAVKVTAASVTDIGCVRRKNQDTLGMAPDLGLFVVCDGMGGAAGGEIASHLAVEGFLECFRADKVAERRASTVELAKNALFHSTMAANAAVREKAHAEPALAGMGTTLVGALVHKRRLLLVNVGDSRAYMVRDGACSQLTTDHSFLDEQVRSGVMTQAMADASSLQSVITRAIGIDDALEPDLYGVDLEDGDFALLTSDGLTRHVSDEEIADLVNSCEGCDDAKLQQRCDSLVALAKKRGGSDNITCILLHFALATHAEAHAA